MGAKIALPEASIVARYLGGESQTAIAADLGVCQATISRALRRQGIRMRQGKSGAAHHSWRGGRLLTDQGYVLVTCPSEYSEMANYLGRPLRADETVHHIDGARTNNHSTNLQLRIGRHGKGSAFACLDCGSGNVAAVALSEED